MKPVILLAKTYEAGREWVYSNQNKYHDPRNHAWFVFDRFTSLDEFLNDMGHHDVSGYMMRDFLENPESGNILVRIYDHKYAIDKHLAIKFYETVRK